MNKGNRNAVKLLMNWVAAMALLVCSAYASMTYAVTVTLLLAIPYEPTNDEPHEKTYWAYPLPALRPS